MQAPPSFDSTALAAALKVVGGLSTALGMILFAIWRSIRSEVRQSTAEVRKTRRTFFNTQMSNYRLLAELNPGPREREIINSAVIEFAEQQSNEDKESSRRRSKPNGRWH